MNTRTNDLLLVSNDAYSIYYNDSRKGQFIYSVYEKDKFVGELELREASFDCLEILYYHFIYYNDKRIKQVVSLLKEHYKEVIVLHNYNKAM